MQQAEIEALIPHRGPMLLIDEVIQRDETRIHCRKTFRSDEFFFQGHYPQYPLVPGVILCEAAMQAGAVLLAAQLDGADGVPVATRMNDVKFRRQVRPGETVDLHVDLQERLSNAFFMRAKVLIDGKAAARFDFACALAPPDAE